MPRDICALCTVRCGFVLPCEVPIRPQLERERDREGDAVGDVCTFLQGNVESGL